MRILTTPLKASVAVRIFEELVCREEKVVLSTISTLSIWLEFLLLSGSGLVP